MKPKDLKFPFRWEERKPHLQQGLLVVPFYYFDHQTFSFPKWEEIFGNSNPIAIEFCSGNGQWITQKALEHPETNWIAVEMDFDRVRKIYSKMNNLGIKNLLIVSGMAQDFVRYYCHDDSVDYVYVNFPDPWPKERAAKHRLIQKPFIDNLLPKIRHNCELSFVTDDQDYFEQICSVLNESVSGSHEKEILPEEHTYGNSWFEELWRSKGLEIKRLKVIYEKGAAYASC